MPRITCIVTLVVLLGSSITRGADGRIPIAEVPVVITLPGSYYLTNDFSPSTSATPVIDIQSSAKDVAIDFNGHFIRMPLGDVTTVVMRGVDVMSVRVAGGKISGGGEAIHVEGVNVYDFSVFVENMQLSSVNGVVVVAPAGASSVRPSANIVGCMIACGSSSGYGISLNTVFSSLVAGNTVSTCKYGIFLQKTFASIVKDNTAIQNQSSGNGAGIRLDEANSNQIVNNNSSLNDEGIYISGTAGPPISGGRNTVSYNTATFNNGNGLRIDQPSSVAQNNIVDWNNFTGNLGKGILINNSTGNICSNNRSVPTGNTIGAGNTQCCFAAAQSCY